MKWPLIFFSLGILLFSLIVPPSVLSKQTVNISKVESGTVFLIRRLSEQDLDRDQRRGWRLFGGALLSGVLGYKYGGGSAVDVKSVLNTILTHNQNIVQGNQLASAEKIRLLELTVTMSNGERQNIILPLQQTQIFRANDKVRLVHFETGVFIDKVL